MPQIGIKFSAIGASAALVLVLSGCVAGTDGNLVKGQEGFREAVEKAQPGDVITLANGTWEDFEIVFTGEGEKDKPIRDAGKSDPNRPIEP